MRKIDLNTIYTDLKTVYGPKGLQYAYYSEFKIYMIFITSCGYYLRTPYRLSASVAEL